MSGLSLNSYLSSVIIFILLALAVYYWLRASFTHSANASQLSRTSRIIANAIKLAAMWFAIGFFGPILLTSASQGPLLGIFITGPLGLLLGLVIGFFKTRDGNRI